MPIAPIQERRPTRVELAMHIKRADQSIIPNISHRALLVELLADSHWRAEVKAQDPNAFIVPFVTSVPNFDYNAYLSSPTWEAIRQTKLEAAGYQCETGCGRRAREVHHRDYRPRVLSGEDLTPLVALCTECHQVVEQDDRGRKRDAWQDKERILAELVAGAGRLARGRDTAWYELGNDALRPDKIAAACLGAARKARQRGYARKYREAKRRKQGLEWKQHRARMSPYALGREDAITHKSAVETYNARPSDSCPFARGTSEEAEYDRGWEDAMHQR